MKTTTKGSQTECLEMMVLPESTRKELRDIGMHGTCFFQVLQNFYWPKMLPGGCPLALTYLVLVFVNVDFADLCLYFVIYSRRTYSSTLL